MRDADGSVSWNDKMITGLSDGNRAEGESLLPGFSVAKHTTKRSGGPFLVKTVKILIPSTAGFRQSFLRQAQSEYYTSADLEK